MVLNHGVNPERFIRLSGDDIEICESYKYLGNIITGTLSDAADIQNKMSKFRGQSFALKKSLGGVRI